MAELGVDPAADPGRLSGGEARRAALVRALSADPDILLLDEPTNHLDLVAIEWLEARLAGSRSALALISHDKRLLADLTRATVWLDRGRTRRLDQGFGAFEAWRDVKLEEEELERHKLDRRIVNEEHWMRYGVTARRKRNMRRVGELADLRRERREALRSVGAAAMVAQDAKASGALVIDAERISKAYDGRAIVRDFSIRAMRGDRIGVVGANGAGKTTLVNMLTGVLAPDFGSVRLGANVMMATLDQQRASLEPTTTLVDALTGGGSDYRDDQQRTPACSWATCAIFCSPPEQARTPIGKLSGGERGRLMLARALAQPSNLMVLDEPTNDLDIETLDLLQELLGDYAGTILVVSHDRDFLDRVATSVIVGEGDGRWVEYAGGYSDMVAQRGCGLAGPLAAPVATAERPDKRPVDRAPREAQARLQREAGARDAAAPDRGASRRPRRCWSASSPTPTSPSASQLRFSTRRRLMRNCATRWPAPRTSGWDWKSCARSSSGNRALQFKNCRACSSFKSSMASRVERPTSRDWAIASSISMVNRRMRVSGC